MWIGLVLMVLHLISIIYELYLAIKHCCKKKPVSLDGEITYDLSSDEEDDRLYLED
jgi:hypothetical protein